MTTIIADEQCKLCGSKMDRICTVPDYPLCGGAVTRSRIRPRTGVVAVEYCYKCMLGATIFPAASAVFYDEDYTSSNIPGDGKLESFLSYVGGSVPHTGAAKRKLQALDIGCYDGSLTAAMRDIHGWDAEGCEPCEWAAKIAREKHGLDVLQRPFSSAAYAPGKFDVVTLRNVLEHVEDPMGMLSDIRYVLVRGGRLVLAVPDGIRRIAEGVLGSVVPEHRWYFSPGSLRVLLERCGFSNVGMLTDRGLIMATATPRPKNRHAPQTPIQAAWPMTGDRLQDRATAVATVLGMAKVGAKSVVLFGANTCALELVARKAVDARTVALAVDDDPYKWYRALAGTDVQVYPRETIPVLAEDGRERVFVVCSYYSQDSITAYILREAPTPFWLVTLYPAVRASLVERRLR